MKTYLVDFENVKSKGLAGIERLGEDEKVVIFYSENSDTITFDMHCAVMRAKAEIEYMKVRVGGKNALDFQLSTLLGYIVAKGENTHIFIISNDKGFDRLHDFWNDTFDKRSECVVYRTVNIDAAVEYAKRKKPLSADNEREEVRIELEKDMITFMDNDYAEQEEGELTVSADISKDAEPEKPQFIIPEQMIDRFRESGGDEDVQVINDILFEIENGEQSCEGEKAEQPLAVQDDKDEPKQTESQAYSLDKDKIKEEKEQPKPQPSAKPKEDEQAAVAKLMERSDSLQQLYLGLIKVYGQKKGSAVYKKVKPEFNAKKPVKNTEKAPLPKKVDTAMKKRLHTLLDGNASSDDFSGVVAMINQSADEGQLSDCLKQRFGEQRGGELFSIVKDEFLAFIGGDANVKKPSPAKKKSEEQPQKPPETKTDERSTADDPLVEKYREMLGGRLNESELSDAVEIIKSSANTHELYLSMIKRFKKQRGLTLYNELKKEFANKIVR
ncbi:MAG: PIN domain-containing protein [Oscillospiraceae bacterium]